MANTFKNASVAVGITRTTLYTCPALTTAVVFSLYLANVDGAAPVNAVVEVYDDSAAVHRKITGVDTPIPIGSSLEVGKIALEAGDILKVTADVAGDLEAFANILEIT